MAGYSYSVSLRIKHPQRTPESITAALGLTPTRSWKVGEVRTTPKGTPLTGIRNETYWTTRLIDDAWPSRDLATAIGAALDDLTGGRAWFIDLNESGGTSELFIGWFFPDGNSGDVFDHKLLARLADFRMDLSFDVYPEIQN